MTVCTRDAPSGDCAVGATGEADRSIDALRLSGDPFLTAPETLTLGASFAAPAAASADELSTPIDATIAANTGIAKIELSRRRLLVRGSTSRRAGETAAVVC